MMFDRAVEHLDGLDDAIGRWIDESPNVVATERDAEASKTWNFPEHRPFTNPIFCEVVFHERYPIGDNWGVVLSDAIRAFRCSLDHGHLLPDAVEFERGLLDAFDSQERASITV